VANGWCWFVLREEYCWLVAGGWFVVREKYCWLVADKPNEQGDLLVILIKPEDFIPNKLVQSPNLTIRYCMYYFETYIHESNDMQGCKGSCNLT
jgi:hypothetical protein